MVTPFDLFSMAMVRAFEKNSCTIAKKALYYVRNEDGLTPEQVNIITLVKGNLNEGLKIIENEYNAKLNKLGNLKA